MAFPPHYPDAIKELEHLAMTALFAQRPPTIQAVASGSWSNPAVWDQGRIPQAGDNACIGAGFKIDVDAVFNDPLATLCVDGGAWLNFLPDRNTGLAVATHCTCTDDTTGAVGKLTIGDQGAPIQSGFSAVWTIADRGIRDDAQRAWDPLDMSGCLMCHGALRMFGAPKTPYVLLSSISGTIVTLASAPSAWNVGDLILFPPMYYSCSGVTATGYAAGGQDEVRQIVAISGNVVTINAPLQYDHTGLLDVCNLTRNVVITSAVKDDLTRRGHVMQMHRSDCLVDSVLFKDLGRTDALRNHTAPQLTSFDPVTGAMGTLVPGTDDNSMGRYGGLHAHIRSGAKWTDNPILVSNSVVWGSPKHGHNNHGGYGYRYNNVLYKCNGSGLFAENSSEIGADRRNVAVMCVGSQAVFAIDGQTFPAPTPQDHGGQGFGFWVTAGIEFTDNRSYGCYFGAFSWNVLQSYDMRWTGDAASSYESWFLTANLNAPSGLIGPDGNAFETPPRQGYQFWPGEVQMLQAGVAVDQTKVQSKTLAVYQARNRFIASQLGFSTYNLANSIFKDMEILRCGAGWAQGYSQGMQPVNSAIRGCDMTKDTTLSPGTGIYGNEVTANNIYTDCTIEGFIAGVQVGGYGKWEFDGCHFNNAFDISVGQRNGELLINNCTFGELGGSITRQKSAKLTVSGTPPAGGDINRYFDPTRVILDGQDVIGDYRLPNYVPFPTNPRPWDSAFNTAWIGLTNQQLFQQFGVWPGGYQIPDQTFTADPRVTGGSLGILGPATNGTPTPPPQVAVPDVVSGFNAAISAAAGQATQALTAAGLTASVSTPIVSQSPAAGTMVNPGSTIIVK